MSKTDTYKTYFSQNIQANLLELPYLDDGECKVKRCPSHRLIACSAGQYEVSMVLILPETSMAYTEQRLTEDLLPGDLSRLFSEEAYRVSGSTPLGALEYIACIR